MTHVQKINSQPEVWALIVCYYPNPNQLLTLVHQLSGQVETVCVLNNGGLTNSLRDDFLKIDNLELHDFNENIGIASALNYGVTLAEKVRADFVVTFDQDSEPQRNHVIELVEVWNQLNCEKTPNTHIGAIGPMFYDERNGMHEYGFLSARGLKVYKHYPSRKNKVVEADVLITSGMLFPISVWQDDLLFNEQLFIDLVDTEWCFRAKEKGYTNFGCFAVKMKHDMSDSHPIRFFGISLLRYGYLRRYYYFRNCVYLLPKAFVPIAYKIRLSVTLLVMLLTSMLIDKQRVKSIQFICKGVYDGLIGKLGRYDE